MDKTIQTKEELHEVIRKRICAIVNERGPIRATSVAVDITSEICQGQYGLFDVPVNNIIDDFSEILEACVVEKGIVELEYSHPATNYKISSLLFPVGTKLISWRGGS